MKEKKRVLFIDIARGIAIILMLVGHTLAYENGFSQWIYSFHMPLFVIASGFFFKEEEKIGSVIKNTFLKLVLLIILVWYICELLFFASLNLLVPLWQEIKYITIHLFETKFCNISVLWFFPFLAMIRIFFAILYKLAKKKEGIVGICSIFLFLLGYGLSLAKIKLPFKMDVAFTCFFLYQIGHLIRKKDIFSWLAKHKWNYAILAVIWLLIAVFIRIDIAKANYGPFGIGLFGAICGTIVMFKISEGIEKIPGVRKFSGFCRKKLYGNFNSSPN